MLIKLSCILFLCCSTSTSTYAQNVSKKLQVAYQKFETDSQLKNSISSLYVIYAKSGKPVFDKNSTIGLATASTLKIITAATAYELLGKDFRYKTQVGRLGSGFGIMGSGDPTFGSWRFQQTRATVLFEKIITAFKNEGYGQLDKLVAFYNSKDDLPPGDWIFEDLANYYGAGAHDMNWHENQYDIIFIPGKTPGDEAVIDTILTPKHIWKKIKNNCKTGPAGSGDNAYIYLNPVNEFNKTLIIEGTVPAGVKRFTISGSDFTPYCSFGFEFLKYAATKGFYRGDENCVVQASQAGDASKFQKIIFTHFSPSLDSIIYWFNKRSINLYGEALVKTFAYQNKLEATTANGVILVKEFWKNKGVATTELNMVDGSGLSPLNRVTTHAQVAILRYAKHQSWFNGFYESLPEFNGIKMKSGTINGVKAFCGYHKSKAGQEYIFSFLVNNYNGSSSALIQKMYKVLDELK